MNQIKYILYSFCCCLAVGVLSLLQCFLWPSLEHRNASEVRALFAHRINWLVATVVKLQQNRRNYLFVVRQKFAKSRNSIHAMRWRRARSVLAYTINWFQSASTETI